MSVPHVCLTISTGAQMQQLGRAIGEVLRAGDLVVLTGDLGAGKTTLTQGIGEGLSVRGPVTSPTFVIARVHPSLVGGPRLVHVDAYRLDGGLELDDLDLDASIETSVTVVEWGEGLAELLADDRLEIRLETTAATGAAAPDEGAPDAAATDAAVPDEAATDAAATDAAVPDEAATDEDASPRRVTLTGVGPRWESAAEAGALVALAASSATSAR